MHRDTGSAGVHCYGPLQAGYVGSVMACEVHDDVDLGSFEDDFWDASLRALFEIERDVSTVRQCEGSRSSSPLHAKGADEIADEGPGLLDVVDMVRFRSAFVGLGDDISPYWTRAVEHANQQAAEIVSLAFPGTTTFRLIAYGYFGRDHGSRQVDLPIGALSDWDRHAKGLWSETAPVELMRAVHLRPQHVLVAGVLSLRVLVSADFAVGWAVCAVECVLGATETVHLCKVPVGVSGYGLLRVVDVPFWGNVIIKRNGIIVRGSDRLGISDGEVVRALVDDDAEEFSHLQISQTVHGTSVSAENSRCDELLLADFSSASGDSSPVMSPHVFDRWCGELRVGVVADADVTSYMQTSSSLRSTAETLHVHKYGMEWITVEYDNVQPLGDAVQNAWHLPSYGSRSIVELHEIPFPPDVFPGRNYIVELQGDAERKNFHSDVLYLVQIFIVQQGASSDRESLFRVMWGPSVATRDRMLHHLRVFDRCTSGEVYCEVYVNKVMWQARDSVTRHFQNGDFVQLLIRSRSGTSATALRCDLRQSEQVERQRRVFNSSSLGSESEPDPAPSEYTRSRSRSPVTGNVVTDQEGEEEDDGDADDPSLLQLSTDGVRAAQQASRPKLLLLDSRLPSANGADWQLKLQQAGSTDPESVAVLRDFLCGLTTWPDCSFVNDWTLIPDAHPFVQLVHQLQPPAACVSAYHIFVDGSFFKKSNSSAWAFEVVLQQPGLEFRRWGFTGAPFSDSPSSLSAEARGALAALHWICCTLVDCRKPTTLYCDATCIGLGLVGAQKLPEAIGCDAGKARAMYQLAKALVPQLQYRHVKAHSGQIDNEVVDSVAKAIASQGWSPFCGIPDFLAGLSLPLWDWAWLLIETDVNDNPEFPALADLVNKTAYGPALTIGGKVFDQFDEVARNHPLCEVDLKFATANVRSLKEHDTSFAGKASILAEQFGLEGLEVVGLQETRARNSTVSLSNRYVRLISASDHGQGGVELWLNQDGALAKTPFGPLTADHCKVWHSSSTVLGVECDHPLLDCDFVVCYAPQAARAKEDIAQWWADLRSLLVGRKQRDLVLLGDFNAKVGAVCSEHVGDWHWDCEDTAGECARELIVDFGLVLPSTFQQWHSGPTNTFRSHTGSGTRVDYVAVPGAWRNGISTSYVSSIDLLSGEFDHSAAVVQLCLTVQPRSEVTLSRRASYDRFTAHDNLSALSDIVKTLPACPVEVDVDFHWRSIEQHCKRCLRERFPKGKRVMRQHYFSNDTWNVLESRKDLQKYLNELDRQEDHFVLQRIFRAWKNGSSGSGDCGTASLSLVRQETVTLWARRVLAGRFKSCRKRDLIEYRANADISFVHDVSGGNSRRIFQALRPRRPVNRSKGFRVPKHLPEIDTKANCRYRGRLVKVWQQHFSSIESADVQPPDDYVESSQPLLQPYMLAGFSLEDIPTRAELEQALRALSWRKAPGYDGIGAELWQGDPEESSLRLYALFLKAVSRGYLPLQFRGGFLVPLSKNKGRATDPSSYRGILLQNTAAKIFVKSWRSRLVEHFKHAAVPLQCGCVKQRGVDTAHLAVRLHQHTAAVMQSSAAVLFIDIKAAYYSVVKELFYDTTAPDGCAAVAALFHRLRLPATAFEDFTRSIAESDLLRGASVPEVLQQLVLATLSNSWFVIPGAADLCIPKTGTRPGDPVADLLFAFAMSQVLFEVYSELIASACLQLVDGVPFGTTWADDTCVLLAGEASSIDSRIAEAFSIVHSALLRHGLSPSYGHGKTSVLVCYRGRESAKYHKRRFAASEPQIPCLVEHGNSVQLAVSQTYRHLGSVVDGDSLLPEVRTRGAMALQAIKPLAKSCLSNWKIPLRRRQQILASLGISVLCHNVGTWRRLNEQEYNAWVSAIWKLYNCMHRNGHGSDYHRRTIEHVALSAGAFAPDALLHVCRLRLFANLLAAPDDLLPRAVEMNLVACGAAPDRSWFGCVQAALDWLEATVGQATLIAGLRVLQPLDLLAARGDMAKGLKRALHQAVSAHQLQLQMIVDLVDADDWIQKELVDSGWTCRVPADQQAERARYRCPDCSASFKGEAHLATHRQRAHQQYVAARSFVLSSRCPACKKDFHTRPRALKHVQYQSTRCLPWLLERGIPVSDDLARSLDAADAAKLCEERRSGIRSKETRMPVDTTQACAPPQVPSGSDVLPQPVVLQGYDKIDGDQVLFIAKWRNYAEGPWTLQEEDWAAFSSELTGAFQQCPVETLESFKGEVCDLVEEISWRQDDYEEVNRVLGSLYGVAKNFWVPQRSRAPPPETPYERLRRLEARFGSLPAWMGLRDHTTRNGFGRPGHSDVFVHLAALEVQWRGEVRLWDPPEVFAARPFFKECFYLILYSGHRRQGDIASQLWQMRTPGDGVLLFPICLDLCIHKELGDLLCPAQQSLWMHRMRQKQVIGAHASPPCETYTDARWLPPPEEAQKPRPLRTWDHPWGLPGLDRAEQAQLRVGNVLFYTAARFFVLATICGCCATLEHPRGSPPESGRFRIWGSAFVERLLRFPRCKLVHFAQGPLGQYSWKPTTFLTLRLEKFEHYIKEASVYSGPFETLGGRNADGEWRTAKAKAFPEGLCLVIARAVINFVSELEWSTESKCCDVQGLPHTMCGPFDPYSEDLDGLIMGPDYWST